MKPGDVLTGFRSDDLQCSIKNFDSAAHKYFAGSRCRHTVKPFQANRNKNILLLQTFNEFFTFLWPMSMSAAGNAEQTGTDENRFGTDFTVK